MWLELVAQIIAAVVLAAAGVRAVIFLASKTVGGFDYLADRRRRHDVLLAVTSEEGWPNGSKTIVEAHANLYEKVHDLATVLEEVRSLLAEVLEQRVDQSSIDRS